MKDTAPNDLANIRNYLFLRAERLWEWSLVLAVGMVGATVAGLWINTPWIVSSIGLIALAFPVAVSWMRDTANDAQLKAEKCRRLILIADGLGHDIAPAELAEVRAWGLGVTLDAAPFVKPYYSSALPDGTQRLADIAAEAAFFSAQLAGKVAAGVRLAFIISVVACVVALMLIDLPGTAAKPILILVAKSTAVFLVFLISGDFFLIAKRYGNLQHASRQALDRCARLRADSAALAEEVRSAVEDYAVALMQCPPIPAWLYLRYRDDLNTVYRSSHQVGG